MEITLIFGLRKDLTYYYYLVLGNLVLVVVLGVLESKALPTLRGTLHFFVTQRNSVQLQISSCFTACCTYTTQTANSNVRKLAEVKDTDFYLYSLYDGHLCKTLNVHLELAPTFLYGLSYLTL